VTSVLVGFEPSEPSVVVLGTEPPRSAVVVVVRYGITSSGDANEVAWHAASVLSAQHIEEALVVGYGPGDLITPVAGALRARFAGAGIAVREVLRAQGGRFWSYLCTDLSCCPAEGTPYSTEAHPLTQQLGGPVFASREALAATVATVTGADADSMRKATRTAEKRAEKLLSEAGNAPGCRERRRALLQPGLQAVASAIEVYRAGGRFGSDEDAAWLALTLQDLRIRDDSWARMDPAHRQAHLRLWTDLTRLARPRGRARVAARRRGLAVRRGRAGQRRPRPGAGR
jgi:hypothetical protein